LNAKLESEGKLLKPKDRSLPGGVPKRPKADEGPLRSGYKKVAAKVSSNEHIARGDKLSKKTNSKRTRTPSADFTPHPSTKPRPEHAAPVRKAKAKAKAKKQVPLAEAKRRHNAARAGNQRIVSDMRKSSRKAVAKQSLKRSKTTVEQDIANARLPKSGRGIPKSVMAKHGPKRKSDFKGGQILAMGADDNVIDFTGTRTATKGGGVRKVRSRNGVSPQEARKIHRALNPKGSRYDILANRKKAAVGKAAAGKAAGAAPTRPATPAIPGAAAATGAVPAKPGAAATPTKPGTPTGATPVANTALTPVQPNVIGPSTAAGTGAAVGAAVAGGPALVKGYRKAAGKALDTAKAGGKGGKTTSTRKLKKATKTFTEVQKEVKALRSAGKPVPKELASKLTAASKAKVAAGAGKVVGLTKGAKTGAALAGGAAAAIPAAAGAVLTSVAADVARDQFGGAENLKAGPQVLSAEEAREHFANVEAGGLGHTGTAAVQGFRNAEGFLNKPYQGIKSGLSALGSSFSAAAHVGGGYTNDAIDFWSRKAFGMSPIEGYSSTAANRKAEMEQGGVWAKDPATGEVFFSPPDKGFTTPAQRQQAAVATANEQNAAAQAQQAEAVAQQEAQQAEAARVQQEQEAAAAAQAQAQQPQQSEDGSLVDPQPIPEVDPIPESSLLAPTGGLLGPSAKQLQQFRYGLGQRWKDGTATPTDRGNIAREQARMQMSKQDKLVLARHRASPKDKRYAAAAAKIKARLDAAFREGKQNRRINLGERQITQRADRAAAQEQNLRRSERLGAQDFAAQQGALNRRGRIDEIMARAMTEMGDKKEDPRIKGHLKTIEIMLQNGNLKAAIDQADSIGMDISHILPNYVPPSRRKKKKAEDEAKTKK